MENGLNAYNRTDTMGKSQLDLILQVYDGAIKTYHQAAENYRTGETEAGYTSLEKAQRFVTHLFTTLDHKKGGEVAENLGRMYAYIINETEGIKGTKDIKKLEDIVKMLTNIRSGWAGLKDNNTSSQPTSEEEPKESVDADGFLVTA